jgi:5-methylcytosine-specific restriction endonuclease McrA
LLSRHKLLYRAYLQSPEWGQFREIAFLYHGRVCSGCGASKRLEVHHMTYRNLFHESVEDVEILCHFCHKTEHRIKNKKLGRGRKKRRRKYMNHPHYYEETVTYFVPSRATTTPTSTLE